MKNGPIFIVGAPRTGTTLVHNILNKNPHIYIFDESHFFSSVWNNQHIIGNLKTEESLYRGIETTVNLCRLYNKAKEDVFVRSLFSHKFFLERLKNTDISYANLLRIFLSEQALSKGKKIWGDSDPAAIYYTGLIKSWYTDARFLGLVRDPRAYTASAKNSWKTHKGSQEQRDYSKKHYNPIIMSLNYRMCMNALLKAKHGQWSNDLYIVNYEKLVSHPEEQIKKICGFLKIDFVESMLNVNRSHSSYKDIVDTPENRGISTASVDKWQEELFNSEKWIIQKMCKKYFNYFGYEPVHVSCRSIDLLKEMLNLPRPFLTILSQSCRKRGSLLKYVNHRIKNFIN